MTDDDHIDDDDLQLKQMRSVWLSMRDDDAEPGDRGMAALMAAAREQADAMKPRRSWWAVLLEQLRRPPVLAMATAVVLIGGAVVISQKNDRGEMQTESERMEPDVADKTVAVPAPAPTPTDEVAKMEAPGGDTEHGRFETATGSAAPAPVEAPVVTQRSRPNVRKPPRAATTEGAQDNLSMAPEPKDPPSEAKKEDAGEKAALQLATGDEDMTPKGGVADSTAGAPPPEHKPVLRKPLPSIEGEDRGGRDTTVAQLVKQCEAAAAKSDCAAVRTIVQKIAKQDPAAYRLKISKNAAVMRCLEPPAPAEAAPTNAQ